MPRRKLTFEVEVNTPSAQREADRIGNIFESRLSKLKVGTQAGGGGSGGGGGGGGGRGGGMGMPGSSLNNLIFGSAQYALAGHFYQFFSQLPQQITEMDKMSTANVRAKAAFDTLAGGAQNANTLITAYVHGTGNVATQTEATTEAMRLYNLGLATNAQQMQKFTTVSRGMAQATGRDVGYIQEQFSLAMANQSLLRFDQLGLSIQRHKEIMQDLKREYPDMSREIMFQNAMLQQATERYYNLATAQESLATSTEIANRQLKNQYDFVAGIVSKKIVQPLMGDVATVFGARDINTQQARLENYIEAQDKLMRDSERFQNHQEQYGQNGSGFWGKMSDMSTYLGANLARGSANYMQPSDAAGRTRLNAANELNFFMKKGAGAANIGVDVSGFVDQVRKYQDAIVNGGEVTGRTVDSIRMMSQELDFMIVALKGQTDANDLAAQSTMDLQAKVEDFAKSLDSTALSLVDKLVEAGATDAQIKNMVPNDNDRTAIADKIMTEALARGDSITREIAMKRATVQMTKPGDDYLQSVKDAAEGNRKAATAAESAAKKWEETVNTTASKMRSIYVDMLHQVPGLFKGSEVTEGDLYLAKKGYPINYADDQMRRLADVALNDKKRGDVDLSVFARAVGHPGETDPKALYYLAQQMGVGLYANPELAKSMINVDAVKQGLHSQELNALGQQTLESMFGAGSNEGQSYLKVFGMKALDPIEDGLITEVTTRGPIMGAEIAKQMYKGFEDEVKTLPWIAKVMEIMTNQTGSAVAQDLNSNLSSDLAKSEAIPVTTPILQTTANLSR